MNEDEWTILLALVGMTLAIIGWFAAMAMGEINYAVLFGVAFLWVCVLVRMTGEPRNR